MKQTRARARLTQVWSWTCITLSGWLARMAPLEGGWLTCMPPPHLRGYKLALWRFVKACEAQQRTLPTACISGACPDPLASLKHGLCDRAPRIPDPNCFSSLFPVYTGTPSPCLSPHHNYACLAEASAPLWTHFGPFSAPSMFPALCRHSVKSTSQRIYFISIPGSSAIPLLPLEHWDFWVCQLFPEVGGLPQRPPCTHRQERLHL